MAVNVVMAMKVIKAMTALKAVKINKTIKIFQTYVFPTLLEHICTNTHFVAEMRGGKNKKADVVLIIRRMRRPVEDSYIWVNESW